MSPDLNLKVTTGGGIMKGIKRSILGSESFFMNTFTASANGGWIQVGATLPGDCTVLEVNNTVWLIQAGSYLASDSGVEVDTKWGGIRQALGGEGFFVLHCSGVGKIATASYGAMDGFMLQPGQTITVDSGHLVAWHDTIKLRPRIAAGGIISSNLSGEGIVVDMVGPGYVITQSRNMGALQQWIASLITPGKQ